MGTVTIETYGSVNVVEVNGRIDSSNAHELDDAFKGLAGNNRHKLVADLSKVNYMSSAGLRALVAALKECKRHLSGDLRLCNPSERAAEVLELAGLTSLFQTFEDQTAAVGSYT
ncbi:MAG: STAS domain-containing protein [Chloroflexi bacterium]|nr:STAS domain-containing protein [Chloroflexota bacterium]